MSDYGLDQFDRTETWTSSPGVREHSPGEFGAPAGSVSRTWELLFHQKELT
jgi:hypothetical protein